MTRENVPTVEAHAQVVIAAATDPPIDLRVADREAARLVWLGRRIDAVRAGVNQ